MRRRSATAPVVLITSAAPSRVDEFQDRRRNYIIVMSTRVACFILAVVIPITWLRMVFLVGALVLPWVAVLAANQVKDKVVGAPALFVPAPRRALSGEDPRPHRADRRP
ncbi:hypothetical protein acdb102_36390 [Acidothermaceae bacterium B102]|nr:hypothetical protein acdb102_36390 [Acidothermaceae bacterium B102]